MNFAIYISFFKSCFYIFNQLNFIFFIEQMGELGTILSIYQPTKIHCWKQASPIADHNGRSCVVCIQRLPATLNRSSVYFLRDLPTRCVPVHDRNQRKIWPQQRSQFYEKCRRKTPSIAPPIALLATLSLVRRSYVIASSNCANVYFFAALDIQ